LSVSDGRHTSAGTKKKWFAVSSSPAQRATFGDVFAVREFRALWLSQILSAGGDRLALVALALLIYDRTRSPLLAAIAYAAGTLPYLIGALFLSGMADRFPRREVMVTCDVVRAALVAAMLVPRMPLDVLIALLYVVTAFQPPFDAARSAILGTWSRESAMRWPPRRCSPRSWPWWWRVPRSAA
jgi:MFS family permease